MRFTWWDVFLNGKKIDKVSYLASVSKEEVLRSLINHEGYSPNIVVKREK